MAGRLSLAKCRELIPHGIGLFTSIGWSNTFSLALEGTGIHKRQVSSLPVMAILGGAILPPLQGKIADLTGNLQLRSSSRSSPTPTSRSTELMDIALGERTGPAGSGSVTGHFDWTFT